MEIFTGWVKKAQINFIRSTESFYKIISTTKVTKKGE